MFNKILVPVDGSEHAGCAVETAADLAVRYDAHLGILHVLEKVASGRVPEGLAELEHIEHMRVTDTDILMSVANAIVRQAVTRCRELGVQRIGEEIAIGNPRVLIPQIALDNGFDLVVMGRRGLGRVADFMLGSVSHRVTQTTDCACLTVKSRDSAG